MVHTDLNGPHSTVGLNGEKYFLTFIDDYSKVAKTYIIKSKGEVHNCFVDYVNIIESKTGKRVYEIMFGDKPSIEHLKLYGSKVFVRVPEQKRNSKWDRKADLGILLGYENVGYRVLVNNKVIVARHVDIVEEGTNCIGLENHSQSVHDVTFNDSNIENDKDEKIIHRAFMM
ncbi:hypothetical protein QE152_g29410 [Popillia japonica]|uniref:Retroviral polymerase SH3-like domain-containing protein n=1 Tax=Popillia japonica TaxID=7064 RepID=A0AAW1JJ28_POPJA